MGIDPGSLVGLRDRALLSVMVYSFARVSAVVGMRRRDYFLQGTRGWLRLHEKGGKRHDVPAHHRAEAAVEAYLVAGGIEDAKAPLFQSVDRSRRLSGRSLTRRVVLAMIKRRAVAAGLPASTCCHTFRATGITAYLSNGGTLEHAQQIAGHASPRTTKLYDRDGGHGHARRDRTHRGSDERRTRPAWVARPSVTWSSPAPASPRACLRAGLSIRMPRFTKEGCDQHGQSDCRRQDRSDRRSEDDLRLVRP